jgi:signal transduction histidine kinase
MNTSELDALLAALHTHGRVSNRDLAIRDSRRVLRHVLVSASLQTAKTGEERVIGSIRDISERKGLEEELRRRVEELQKIMDVAPVALFVANDPECREVIVNRMGNVMLEVAQGANSLSAPGGPTPPCPFFRDGIEIPVHELPLQTAARGVEVRDCELEALLPSGKRRLLWGHASPLRDAGGQVRGAIAAFQDVTEIRQRTDAILRESEQHLKNAERLAHVGHWQWDVRANRVSGSEEMYRIFGKPQNCVPSYEGFLEDLMPEDRERVEGLIRDSLATKIGHSVEYQIAHPNGDLRTIFSICEVLLDEEGLPMRMFGTCQDITDSRRAQEESFARQKLESLGTLAGGIAHDFNNLLGGVLAHSELALAELASSSNPTEELQRIREGAIRGAEIVRQLMIYAGQESEVLELVDVSEIVKDMLELLKVSVSKHVSVESDLSKQLRPVRANPSHIRQIVMNLFYNASEAIGDRDGVIRVTTWPVIGASEGMAGDYVQLEVSDTGRGMTPEVQARVFDMFFTTKAAGSHGLGLAGVQRIVEHLHGTIRLSSAPAKGTTFQIMLPCEKQMVAASHSAPARAEDETLAARGTTILVVEDESLLRQGVSKMLRKNGLSVLEASDGSAALEVIRAQKDDIDVLFMDITIPGASSREVYEEAKRLRPDLPVIVTSAKSEAIAAASLGTGIERFLRKPFSLGDLINIIRETLSS